MVGIQQSDETPLFTPSLTPSSTPSLTPSLTPSFGDRAKIRALLRLREYHAHTVERASAGTYRQRRLPTPTKPVVEPAAQIYAKNGMDWLPASLVAPRKTPKAAALPMGYYLPYYATSKIAWTLYEKAPINRELPWSDQARWDQKFPGGERGWDELSADRAFAQLRLQGPNPFLLRQDTPDAALGEEPDALVFVVDYDEYFAGMFDPVACRFAVDSSGDLMPTSIKIGDRVHRRTDDFWPVARRIANGLDARYSVFGVHLVDCHLIVGQAYALSSYALPTAHRLRSFLDFFTYGTLPVNDAAYQALLVPTSYFVMSNFIGHNDAPPLVSNIVKRFDFGRWIAPLDIARRGLDSIAGHPYAQDGLKAWEVLLGACQRHVDVLYADDTAVLADAELQVWYAELKRGLLGSPTVPALTGSASLAELLAVLLYNNVIHEVCGNLAPLFGAANEPADKIMANIDHLRTAVDPEAHPPSPLAHEVFLVDQAVFVSRFNVGGNNLLHLDGDRYINDPKLQAMVHSLQRDLGTLDAELADLDRPLQFNAMLPRKWEASISF